MAKTPQQTGGAPEAQPEEKKPIANPVEALQQENAALRARVAQLEIDEIARRSPPGATLPINAAPMSVKVVSNYGGWKPGEIITVDRKEYLKFRKIDESAPGGFRCPVFISEEDEITLKRALEEENARVEAEAAQRARQSAAHNEDGWARYQQESARIVNVQRQQEAERLRELMFSGQTPQLSQEEQEARYRAAIRTSRTGEPPR